jgi:hypothetical protein
MLFAGCKSSNSSSSGSSSSNSQTEVAATVNSTSAPEVFNNFTLELNPEIVITGNTATYYNDDGSQGFELATSILTDVSVKYDDTPDGGLLLIFTSPSFSDGNITITLSGFVDRGNEGYIDEFTVEKAEVNKNDGTTTEITSVANTKKSNLGTKLKRSASDMTENNISLPDFSGSPTVDEWNKYMVGTALLATDLSTTGGDLTFVQFTSSTDGIYYDITGSDAGDSGNFTYTYSQDSDTTGKLVINLTWTESDTSNSDYGTSFAEVDYMDLTFSDFYNGDYKETGGTETNLKTGEIKQDAPESLDSGVFNTITNVEVYLEEKKITVSTN